MSFLVAAIAGCAPVEVTQSFFDPLLPIYTDGSCLHPADARIASVGSAAVQVDPDGNTLRAIMYTPD